MSILGVSGLAGCHLFSPLSETRDAPQRLSLFPLPPCPLSLPLCHSRLHRHHSTEGGTCQPTNLDLGPRTTISPLIHHIIIHRRLSTSPLKLKTSPPTSLLKPSTLDPSPFSSLLPDSSSSQPSILVDTRSSPVLLDLDLLVGLAQTFTCRTIDPDHASSTTHHGSHGFRTRDRSRNRGDTPGLNDQQSTSNAPLSLSLSEIDIDSYSSRLVLLLPSLFHPLSFLEVNRITIPGV